jgi:hypothetical protein
LEESRRELNQLKIDYDNKENSLLEELNLKNKKLYILQSKVSQFNDILNVSNVWRNTSEELSKYIILMYFPSIKFISNNHQFIKYFWFLASSMMN